MSDLWLQTFRGECPRKIFFELRMVDRGFPCKWLADFFFRGQKHSQMIAGNISRGLQSFDWYTPPNHSKVNPFGTDFRIFSFDGKSFENDRQRHGFTPHLSSSCEKWTKAFAFVLPVNCYFLLRTHVSPQYDTTSWKTSPCEDRQSIHDNRFATSKLYLTSYKKLDPLKSRGGHLWNNGWGEICKK